MANKKSYKDLVKNPTLAKNAIIKKYHFILSQHNAIGKKLRYRKDETQKRAFMQQSWYKKRHEIIVNVFNSIDELIKNDADLWNEAIELCADPRDYDAKQVKGKAFDLKKEYDNLKSFYIKPEKVVKKKSTKKTEEVKDNG